MLEDGKNSKTGEPIIPTISTLKKIATALEMPLNDLLSLAEDMPVSLEDILSPPTPTPSPDLSDAEAALLELFRAVPPEHRPMILGMIEGAINNLIPPK
jgi:hypothetical protein